MNTQNQNINFPRHIGLIADGNRRWAKEHNLPKFEGHRRGFEAIKKIARAAQQKGIEMFTFWCFSTENWNRPAGEVAYLMDLFESSLDEFGKMAEQNKARLRIIGQKWRFRPSIQKKIEDVEKTTINNSGTILNMGLSYGGRDEIIQGIKKIIENHGKLCKTLSIKYPIMAPITTHRTKLIPNAEAFRITLKIDCFVSSSVILCPHTLIIQTL